MMMGGMPMDMMGPMGMDPMMGMMGWMDDDGHGSYDDGHGPMMMGGMMDDPMMMGMGMDPMMMGGMDPMI